MTQTTHTSSSPAVQWGYQHPECRGENALVFFTWDLGRVVESALQGRDNLDEALPDAQAAVDGLLREYVARRAAPDAFEGQSIVLRIETDTDEDGDAAPYVALQTTPHLEQLILESQARLQNSQPGAANTH
ncbi:hypothetical protein V8Z80_10965 [Orrella sp. JC864]|uniref:hypothetical protein n=1 Tax=Orrella sp. JC864 TaxID=3120298 RepID=UPI0012BC3CEA